MRKTHLFLSLIIIISLVLIGCKGEIEDTVKDDTPEENITEDTAPPEKNQTEPVVEEPGPEEELEPEGFTEEEYTLSYTLADIETFIVGMDYLIGTDAPAADVITVTNIKTLYISRDIDTGDAKLTNEVDDYKDDFIIVGSPCDNPAAASFFAEEIEEKGDCKIFPAGEALIKLKAVSNNDIILYIGGNTPAETALAEEVIKYPNQHDLSGTEIKVTSGTDGPVISIVN